MSLSRPLSAPLVAAGILVLAPGAGAQPIVPKHFDPPGRTTWVPEGCRAVPADADALASRETMRLFHSDEVNTDEVSIALAPVFRTDWTTENATWHATGPVFDSAGNLYFTPVLPYENVALISLDPNDGSRRFSVPNTTGAPAGVASPFVLNDPDNQGEEMVVVALYDRAFAVRTDGSVLWDVPTGLPSIDADVVFGVNYLPEADALVAVSRDGFVYALDRKTGAPVLSAPFELPGEVSPPGSPFPLPLPAAICALQTLAQFVDVSGTGGFGEFLDVLNGNNTEVANFFSVDANTSRLWIAATAPDAEDGTVDGVSELGALYRLDLVAKPGGSHDLVEHCHASFAGGSASTPALPTDGSRVYVGDNFGKLIAVEPADCSRAWSLDVGSQIIGSIGVSSDNGELYAPTVQGIASVIDEGGMGRLRWYTDVDAFDFTVPGLVNMNTNLVSIGANALQVQIGAGFPGLPLVTGIGQVDRDTGALRYFTVGTEETVAVMNTGPDGAVYIGNSPFRRILANCLAQTGNLPFGGPPVRGGITRYAAERHDLLIRDAVCAGEDRARNAFAVREICPDSAHADAEQIGQLVAQARRAAPVATQSGDLTAEEWAAVEKELQKVDKKLATGKLQHLDPATEALSRACHDLGG